MQTIVTFVANNTIMADKISYKSMNLPADLVEELKVWRQAYMVAYGRTVSYGEIIRGLLDGLDTTEPDVVKAMDMLIAGHPELGAKIGKYKGIQSEEE